MTIRRTFVIGAMAIVVLWIALFLGSVRFAGAHDHDNPAMNQWASSLLSRGKVLCCNGKDYVRLDGSDWDMRNGHYVVYIRGVWMDVPDDAVVDGPNLAGEALVWMTGGINPGVRCFMPGALT